ncbi:MarR family winged helix-turn-helix transcriptional regulator [Micromonospora azadirachtae]|uniref:MarR family winged helix-turn-helix transcriptional regulator n=1 Tax=Micromonospora azadirachtae TaxID=1970735 RepID=A0ABW3A6N1_9ACTN
MATEHESPRPLADRQVCGLVRDVASQVEAHLRARAATLGLTATQATALCELTHPMTLRDLAERMSCEPSNITFVADRLEGQGYLERHPHPEDRRAKQLILTPEGTELRGRLIELLSTDSPLAPLAAEEQETLRNLLTRALIR